MPHWDLLLTDGHAATMQIGGAPYGVIRDAAVAISADRIAWIGPARDLPDASVGEQRSLEGRWMSPALIDCHTHLVFGGNRAAEFEQRLSGVSYAEIAKSGGGIAATVTATRAASASELLESALEHVLGLRAEGVATIEVKSGYGLDRDNEIKMLEVARDLETAGRVSIQTTYLGAHAVPAEYRDCADDYLAMAIDEVLPQVRARGLADAVDAYCESIAFSPQQIARLFERANELGLPVKLHADQLTDGGGAELAARYGALSADHLEFTSAQGVAALARSGTVAVLLPGAFLNLAESQRPPIALLRAAGVPMALATDLNPGSSPLRSLRAAMHLAATLFRLTPEECLAAVTRNAAHALGLGNDRGMLAAGARADIAIWDIGGPAELTYWLGGNPLTELCIGGTFCDSP